MNPLNGVAVAEVPSVAERKLRQLALPKFLTGILNTPPRSASLEVANSQRKPPRSASEERSYSERGLPLRSHSLAIQVHLPCCHRHSRSATRFGNLRRSVNTNRPLRLVGPQGAAIRNPSKCPKKFSNLAEKGVNSAQSKFCVRSH